MSLDLIKVSRLLVHGNCSLNSALDKMEDIRLMTSVRMGKLERSRTESEIAKGANSSLNKVSRNSNLLILKLILKMLCKLQQITSGQE